MPTLANNATHQGNICEVLDSGQTIVARYDYSPFGEVDTLTETVSSDFRYTGHFYHVPTGLHLTLYRAYDPAQGRWLSRDPIGEAGGLNLYGYVGNNVVNFWDTNGLFPQGTAYGTGYNSSQIASRKAMATVAGGVNGMISAANRMATLPKAIVSSSSGTVGLGVGAGVEVKIPGGSINAGGGIFLSRTDYGDNSPSKFSDTSYIGADLSIGPVSYGLSHSAGFEMDVMGEVKYINDSSSGFEISKDGFSLNSSELGFTVKGVIAKIGLSINLDKLINFESTQYIKPWNPCIK